jgi:hypothetical protein
LVFWESLGPQLERFAEQAGGEIVLAAPFIKLGALKKIIGVAGATPIICYTRWRADEVLAGVSDLTIWPELRERPNTSLRLINPLHAKYFRFDHQVVVGSCNITSAALGYAPNANLEMAVSLARTVESDQFEKVLFEASVEVTDELHAAMERAVAAAALARPALAPPAENEADATTDSGEAPSSSAVEHREWSDWLPSCRAPEMLFQVYGGTRPDMSGGAYIAALEDLACLDLPVGLPEAIFSAYVSTALLASPMVSQVAQFAATARRFGEMRAFLKQISGTSNSTNDWQTLMRWLLYFQPDRFEMHTANYSEIFKAKW